MIKVVPSNEFIFHVKLKVELSGEILILEPLANVAGCT